MEWNFSTMSCLDAFFSREGNTKLLSRVLCRSPKQRPNDFLKSSAAGDSEIQGTSVAKAVQDQMQINISKASLNQATRESSENRRDKRQSKIADRSSV